MQSVRRAVGDREQRFVTFLESHVYGHERSPYRRLLLEAGCELSDVARLVRDEGLEGALRCLYDAGVYVTHDEMKGREPVRRGSAAFEFAPCDFDNPVLAGHVRGRTSGSTGDPGMTRVNVAHFRERRSQNRAFLAALGMPDARVAIWLPPVYSMVAHALKFSGAGTVPRRWFSQVPVASLGSSSRMRFSACALIALCRALGTPLPMPRHVPLERPGPVVGWATATVASGRPAVVDTYTSSAVRAALWAQERAVSLAGVGFVVTGESLTPARRASIEATGAKVLIVYGNVEHGLMAAGCQCADGADDMHIFGDTHALISRPLSLPGGEAAGALLVTDFSQTAPKIALNAGTGDCGTLVTRTCGCPWEGMGYGRHLRDVWSYAKLTTEGLTFDGAHVFDAIERVLPARFGGRAGDYQLIARAQSGGVTRYLLAVSPAVGPVDTGVVRTVFLEAVAGQGPTGGIIADFMRGARQLRVVRQSPVVLDSGKSLPVVLQRKASGRPERA
jgi:hypothetical protein